MTKLSVIIPVYNASRFLRECLDSVLAAADELEKVVGVGERMASPLVEVICVDDGSTDGSGAILEEYARRQSNNLTIKQSNNQPIFRIIHQTNAGVWAARNAALDAATGEWVTFIDSDDTIEAGWFVEAEKLMAEDVDLVRLQEKWGRFPGEIGAFEGASAAKWCWQTLSECGYLWLCFIRRSAIGALRFRPIINCKEDGIFLMELTPRIKKAIQGTYAGYVYRMMTGSLTKKNRRIAQCVAYLEACREIWQEQSAWARGMKVESVVRRRLRIAADHDVWEWFHLRCPHDDMRPDEITRAYRCLEASGALWPEWCHRNRRLQLPFWLWRKTGSLIGFGLLEWTQKTIGRMLR